MLWASMAKTVTLLVKEIPQDLSRVALVGLLREHFNTWVLKAVQFLPGMRAHLTFDSAEAKLAIEKNKSVFVGGHKCLVLGGGPRGENVLVFHFSYEEDVKILKDAMKRFGTVVGVRYQSYPSVDVHTSNRVVRMIRNRSIPHFLDVGGYLCKVWYCRQPIVCDICGGGHVSRNCPLKGKCCVCNQEGHYARNFPSARGDDWGDVVDAPADLSSAAGGDGMDFELGSGGPPFDHQRDNQLDELQSGLSQIILANVVVVVEPSVKDRDLNSVSGSESNLSVVSNNVSSANAGNLVNEQLPSASKESELHNGNKDSDLNNGNKESELHNGKNDSDLNNGNKESELHSGNKECVLHNENRGSELISEINESELHSNVTSKTPVLQSGNVAVAGPVAELCMASSEDDSVDTPAELSGWAKAISRKLKLRKEPAKKAVIPIVAGRVRKKNCPCASGGYLAQICTKY